MKVVGVALLALLAVCSATSLRGLDETPTECITKHCLPQATKCELDAGCKAFTSCAAKCKEPACYATCMGTQPDAATVAIIACARTNKCGVPTPSAQEVLSVEADASEPCCNTCTVAGQEKYFSIDKTHNMCGEACMEPSKFSLYKMFEPGLTKATDNTPCADAKYSNYDSTVTHGFGPVKMTLDLYKPSEEVEVDVEVAADPNVTIYKVDYPDQGQGECGEMDMAESVAKWPISMGGFKKGTCANDASYTVADGEKQECYMSHCSMVRIFKKAAWDMILDAAVGEAPAFTDCASGGEVMAYESATVTDVHPGKAATFSWTGTLSQDLDAASTNFKVYAKKLGKWVAIPWSTDYDLSKLNEVPAKAGEVTFHLDMTLPGMVPTGRFMSQLLTTSGSTKVSCLQVIYDVTKA